MEDLGRDGKKKNRSREKDGGRFACFRKEK